MKHPLPGTVGERNFLAAFDCAPRREYAKNEIIISPEEPARGIYFIEHGFVKDFSISTSGDEQLNVIFRRDDIFPIRLLLQDRPRDAYFECMEDTVVRVLPKVDFEFLLKDDPEAASYVLRKLIEIVNLYELSVDSLTMKTANQKILAQLRTFARRYGKHSPDGIVIDAPITHNDIANSTGLARETATRQLNELRKKGLILLKKRRFVIPDPAKLQAMLLMGRHTGRNVEQLIAGGANQQSVNFLEQHPRRSMQFAIGLFNMPASLAKYGALSLSHTLLILFFAVLAGTLILLLHRRRA